MKVDPSKNNIYIGKFDKITEWNDSVLLKLKSLIKNYLELDNVSFLFGAGSSINLGSTSISTIPKSIENAIKEHSSQIGNDENLIYKEFVAIVSNLMQIEKLEIKEDINIDYPLEKLLDYLTALSFVIEKDPKAISYLHIDELIKIIKKRLFELCDLDLLDVKKGLSDEDMKLLTENRYVFHEQFLKKILQRPLNLRRINLFTTNYDLAFEYAFDNIGVKYIDGFSGFNHRTFKPESYDYDIFYPGSTTEGTVHRIEKVIKYFKLHGSLTWKFEEHSPQNIYGIKEYPIDLIRFLKDKEDQFFGDLMIYPTAAKKSYTLDYPYSELFRQFANSIIQPQSVLITYGFSFSDEHIRDIIYQALSIPTFTLIIIDFLGTNGSEEIQRLYELDDPRIIIIQGEQFGDFAFFVKNIIPDLVEFQNEQKLASTLKKLFDVATNDKPVDPVEDLNEPI